MFKKLKLLFQILRTTGMLAVVETFLVFLFIAGYLVIILEPNINNISDSVWYLFASFTTIGYGDFVAVTDLGRIVTIVVSLYGILVVAFIPAIIINYSTEFNKRKSCETMTELHDKLEKLPELSKEELQEISEKFKKNRYKL